MSAINKDANGTMNNKMLNHNILEISGSIEICSSPVLELEKDQQSHFSFDETP